MDYFCGYNDKRGRRHKVTSDSLFQKTAVFMAEIQTDGHRKVILRPCTNNVTEYYTSNELIP